MKTVAKHDNQWKLQKHETHQVVERNCVRASALYMRGLRPWRPCGLVGFVLTATQSSFYYRPELCKIYPLNLSISLSGGKESNSDSISNGE
eukprot:gene11584-biopygen22901